MYGIKIEGQRNGQERGKILNSDYFLCVRIPEINCSIYNTQKYFNVGLCFNLHTTAYVMHTTIFMNCSKSQTVKWSFHLAELSVTPQGRIVSTKSLESCWRGCQVTSWWQRKHCIRTNMRFIPVKMCTITDAMRVLAREQMFLKPL
jgi:hypothetical protein